jgi:hypothetical protein
VRDAWNRYFHASYGAARPYLFSKVFFLLLALDTWMLMIGHAGRYGVLGFNVAHFNWLDALQPVPSPGVYIGVLLLTGLLSLHLFFTGLSTIPALLLCTLYTYSWSMSMLDSYQHHYFVSLVLLCIAFFPRVGGAELHPADAAASRSPLKARGFGFPLLGVLVAIVYVYTAIAKMDAAWVDGHTIYKIGSAREGFAGLVAYLGRFGIEEERAWSLIATFVIPQELFMGVGYLVAVTRDRSDHWAVRLVCALAFLLALTLHVGAENMGLKIGWFSYYMLVLGTCFLLPLGAVDALARVFSLPARTLQAFMVEWEQETLPPAGQLALAAGAAVVVAGAGHLLDLPGAQTATLLAGAVVVALAVAAVMRGRDPRRGVTAVTAAAITMWLAIVSSDVRWEYYRYAGGDHYRRSEYAEALRDYVKGERYAPEGETRQPRIDKLRTILSR